MSSCWGYRVRSRNMRDWKAIVAKNVRKLLQQRKLTQEQLAFASKSTLLTWEGSSAADGTQVSW